MNITGPAREINFGRWAAQMIRAPQAFFAQMPRGQGYGKAVLFALFWFAVTAVVETLVGWVRLRGQFNLVADLGWILLGPFVLLACLFIANALVFVVWHLMGSTENYRTSFWCLALMTPLAPIAALLGLVPYLHLIVFIWGIYLVVIASEAVHGIPRPKAWTLWGVLGGLFLLLTILLALGSRQMAGPGGWSSGAPNIDTANVDESMEAILNARKEQAR